MTQIDPQKIIVIDDEPIHNLVFERLMRNFNPSLAIGKYEEAPLAYESLKNDSDALPSKIFLDLNMPVMNGWDFLELVQSNERLRNSGMVVYILSSSINPADIARSKEYSMVSNFIPKPLTMAKITQIFEP
jgi:CheY-like chemotaxis protein